MRIVVVSVENVIISSLVKIVSVITEIYLLLLLLLFCCCVVDVVDDNDDVVVVHVVVVNVFIDPTNLPLKFG